MFSPWFPLWFPGRKHASGPPSGLSVWSSQNCLVGTLIPITKSLLTLGNPYNAWTIAELQPTEFLLPYWLCCPDNIHVVFQYITAFNINSQGSWTLPLNIKQNTQQLFQRQWHLAGRNVRVWGLTHWYGRYLQCTEVSQQETKSIFSPSRRESTGKKLIA